MLSQVDQPEGQGSLSTLADAAAHEAVTPAPVPQASSVPAEAPGAPVQPHVTTAPDEDDLMDGMDDELRAALQMSLQVPHRQLA